MPKYQSSGKYRSKQRYNRSLGDIYRSLQNLYKIINQLQKYKSSGNSSFGSHGYRPPKISRYQPERQPTKYTKEKVEPRYVVKTETPRYRIETPTRQISAEQLAEEAEKKIEPKLRPLIEGIESKLSEISSPSAETELDNLQTEKTQASLDEIREHALELREFEDLDWEGSHEDAEFLLDMRDALVHSLEKPEQGISESSIENQTIESEPVLSDVAHGTELSTEVELLPQVESSIDEMDFFALESELFGIDSDIEAEVEDQSEVGFA